MSITVFKIIESIIGVPFVADTFETGSVCLAMDEDLRFDFQTQFTTYDVVNYVYGVVSQYEINSIESFQIPYPVDAAFFWKNSSEGKKIRLERPIPELECRAVEDLKWEVFS